MASTRRLRTSEEHLAVLAEETTRLLEWTRASAMPDGTFAWLDDDGHPDPRRPRELWITTRMTHVLGLGALLGREGDAPLAEAGLAALRGVFADDGFGGWYGSVRDGVPVDTAKRAYGHAFVLLAASTAHVAGLDADPLLTESAQGLLRFWDDGAGALVDVWDRRFTHLEAYRGANANMHGVEAMLAAADATGDAEWVDRAASVADRLVLDEARTHGWRVPEHHDEHWRVVRDYNADRTDDPFRPYGTTPGHGLEWARLLMHLNTRRPDSRYVDAARHLFATAVADAWSDERPGLAYTTDWDGTPLVRERFHWVLCEAIGAAAVLADVTGEETYDDWYERFWTLAQQRFVDHRRGGWVHELDEDGRVSRRTWSGKPDTYHAVQACLLPRIPLTASVASGVAALRR